LPQGRNVDIFNRVGLLCDLPLVTRNVDDFKHIARLQIINPFAEPESA